MKTARLFFMIAGFGVWVLATGFADDAPPPPPQTSPAEKHTTVAGDHPTDGGQSARPRTDKEPADSRHADDKKADPHSFQKISHAGKIKQPIVSHTVSRPSQTAQPNIARPGNQPVDDARIKNAASNAADLPSSGLNKPIVAGKTSSTINSSSNFRGRPLAGLSPPPPPNQVIPRPGPGPAVIGGAATSGIRTTAVLNGTGMRRTP